MSKLGSWSMTAGSNNATPPDGWPEGQAPSTVNDCAREMMAQIRAAFSDVQYFDQNLTPTFINATSFSVVGDQTSAIHAGRRLKIFDATAGVATTIYATVLTASFTVVTTVSISADGGQLTSSLSSFALAIISNTNSSLPRKTNMEFGDISASSIVTTTIKTGSWSATGAEMRFTGTGIIGGDGLIDFQSNTAVRFNRSAATISRVQFFLGDGTGNIQHELGSTAGSILCGQTGTLSIGGPVSISGAATLKSTLSVSGTVVAANVAKAWARFDLLTPPVISSSFNVTSISRSATGVVRLNFTTAFVDTSFAWNITYNAARFVQSVSIASGSSFKFTTVDTGGTPTDTIIVNATFYR